MEEAYEVYELQRAQLLHTKGELASATERIGKELRNLSRRISEMSREAGGAPEDGLGAGGSFFSVLEKAVVELTEVVNEQSEINKEMASTIESLSWAVSQMEGFVKEIVKIGIEMKMISLNAAIHAAHVGEQGLALGVLAEHIHSLSQATSGKMTSISEDLNCIVDHAGRLKNSAGVVSRRKAGEGLQMIEDLNRMIPYLRGLDAEAICMLKRIDTEGAGLSMETRKRTEALHFHEQIIQGIESLASEIEKECTRIGSRLKNKGKRGNRSNGIAGMEELAKSYTMQKERDVHRSMLGRLEAKGRSFSTGDEADPYEVIRKGNVEELGENVELF
jgi:methyl-accepting chemotaxis protein